MSLDLEASSSPTASRYNGLPIEDPGERTELLNSEFDLRVRLCIDWEAPRKCDRFRRDIAN
jgi:hypothetical protein